MAADNDVLDLEVLDGVFDHALRTDVRRVHLVGDVAMHEHVSRFQAGDRRLRYA